MPPIRRDFEVRGAASLARCCAAAPSEVRAVRDLPGDSHRESLPHSLEASRARRSARDRPLVLFGVYDARRNSRRPSLAFCGDDAKSKRLVARIIREVGFEPVDVGRLRIARYLEPFALLVAQVAYEGSGGPEVAYRFERFAGKARRRAS